MGNFLSHTIVGVVSAIVMFGVIAAVAWFGAPRVVAWIVEGEKAKAEVTDLRQQLGALQAKDLSAANNAQSACDARVASAVRSAALVARMAAPRPRTVGAPQATVGNGPLLQLIGQGK